MDAAAAAAMSDPDRNPNFRRRWDEGEARVFSSVSAPPERIGTFGLVLQEALLRRSGALRPPLPEDGPHG